MSWTRPELVDVVHPRQLGKSISPSHVNLILCKVNLKPHRSRYWSNITQKDTELFQQNVKRVCRI